MFAWLRNPFKKKEVVKEKKVFYKEPEKKATEKLEPIQYEKNQRRIQNAVLSKEQIHLMHHYYFHVEYQDRLTNINHTKFTPRAGRNAYVKEKVIDGCVHDYIIAWATTEDICEKWNINLGILYANVRFIIELVENYAVSE